VTPDEYEAQKREGRYRILSTEDARAAGVAISPYADEHASHLVEFCADGSTKMLGSDGGEPEDQKLTRDGSWVPEALRTAYATGYAMGRGSRVR
jgi:hypothetical protein